MLAGLKDMKVIRINIRPAVGTTQDIAIHFILFTLSSNFIYNLWEVLLGRHYLRNNLIKNLILIKCHVNYYSFKILLWVILSLWSSGSSHPNYTFYNYNFLFCFLLVGGTLDTKGLIKSWDWWCTKGKGKVNRFLHEGMVRRGKNTNN